MFSTLVKRIFDVIASLLGLIILMPLLIMIGLLIKLKMKGPVLFCQEREGRHRKPFILYKFRTMILNHGGNTISVKGESRITPVGSKLRKYKFDELPELWNVLRGDMSFVGPRPDTREYIDRLSGDERRILDLRPGITSPASLKYINEEELVASAPNPIMFYNEVIWPDKVRLNLEYCINRSFCGDMLLILKTLCRRRIQAKGMYWLAGSR